MASRVRVSAKVVGGILKGKKMEADITRRISRIQAAAGPGMEASVIVGRNRVRGSVITATDEARTAEATSRSLTRAIDAGRG